MDSTEVLSKNDMWEHRIREYHLSGLTCKEWCKQNQISVSTLGYWIRKQKAKNNLVEEDTIFAKLPSEDEMRQVTLKEIHWLCDGLSINPKGAFKDRHPKIVV